MMQGQFRWKAILLSVVCFVLVGTGWFFLHRFQRRSIQNQYLEQATRAEENNPPQYDRAARFLRIYLLAKGDDVDALVRYGVLIDDKLAKTPKMRSNALGVYERVLLQDEARQDISFRAAKLCIELRRIDDALRYLQKADATNPQVDILKGDCKQILAEWDQAKQQFLWTKAAVDYRSAISRAPYKTEAYWRLAQLLRNKQKRPFEAAQVMESLIRANELESRAYLMRAEFRQSDTDPVLGSVPVLGANVLALLGAPLEQGPLISAAAVVCPKAGKDLFGAGQDVAQARKLAPNDADVLLVSAFQELLLALENGQTNPKSHLEEARVYLRRAEQLHPEDTRILPRQAAVELADGRRKEGLDLMRKAQIKARGDEHERKRLLWDLALLLIEDDIKVEAQEIIDELKKIGELAARVSFLQATLEFKQSDWNEAARLLETARPMLLDNTPLVLRADLLLASCYEQMGNLDQQLAIYQRAKKLDPLHPAPRFGLAKTLTALGKLEEAIEECGTLPEGKLLYVRLIILKNLRLPPSETPDWTEVTDVLKKVASNDRSKTIQIDMLRAEAAFAQGVFAETQGKSDEAQGKTPEAKGRFKESKDRFEEAKVILQEAKKKSPHEIEPLIALAVLAGRQGGKEDVAEAIGILEQAKTQFPDRPEWRLAKLRYVPPKKDEALAFLRPLSENLSTFDRANQGRLLKGLAEAFETAGDVSEAEKMWQRLAKLERKQLGAHLVIFDFFLRTKNADGMKKTLASIEEIEGKDGPLGNYGKAQVSMFLIGKRLLPVGKVDEQLTKEEKELKKLAVDARRHLFAASVKRPGWSRIPVSLAAVDEVEGNSELALKHLGEAVSLGNRQLPVIKALVVKLMEKRQFTEADKVLRKLQEIELNSDNFLQMKAAEVSLFNQNIDRALDLTKAAISEGSKNFEDYLWQGQMLSVMGKKEDAEASLRTAIKLAGDDPRPWAVLVQLQASTGNTKKAMEIMEEMKGSIAASKLPFTLAHCYHLMGDHTKAEKAFLEAIATQPNDLEIQRTILKSVVTFYQNTNKPSEAEPYLRQLLEPKLEASEVLQFWARRNLALALAFQRDPKKQSQAMAFVEHNLKLTPSSIDDQLVKGILLGTNAETRGESIRMLEAAFKVRQPTADQMFILANVYEANGDWRKASATMLNLLKDHVNHNQYPLYLVGFIDKLMIKGELDLAEGLLPRLREWANKYRSDPQRLAMATSMLTELVQRHPSLTSRVLPESELLRTFTSKTGKKENQLALAQFLAKCQKLEDSLEICEQVFKESPNEQVIAVAVTAVSENRANPKQFERVETWLKAARQLKSEVVEWDIYLAILMERQTRYREAEKLYRNILKRDPQNLTALNNLAFLIGLQGQGEEAIGLIQRAINAVGPAGEFLDTRAAILRAQGKLPEAAGDLQNALSQARTPYRLFHRAQIEHSAGKTTETKKTFEEAVRQGLRVEMMHPLELESYQTIQGLK